ncbi:MAG: PepSY domain-containing protein [Gammaproteobacteria bacterium]|nr:PepSY domain-containing protein [Gammaproteobacteria bacterium]
MKFLRTIHAWIGIVFMPWIVVIGLTGLYLNHAKVINNLLYERNIDEALLDQKFEKPVIDKDLVQQITMRAWAVKYRGKVKNDKYHRHKVIVLSKRRGKILVSRDTGHYWVKSNFMRKTYNPEGGLLHTKFYWGRIFKYLHTDGWVGGGMGSWLADFTAGAMVVFGFSGMVIFFYPRIRRFKRRWLRK